MRCGTEGDRVVRHNNLRNLFFKECQKALVAPVLEPTNLVRNCGERPADWGIPDYRPGRFMAYDVAVTDPTLSKPMSWELPPPRVSLLNRMQSMSS
jgi:hypothetical protein